LLRRRTRIGADRPPGDDNLSFDAPLPARRRFFGGEFGRLTAAVTTINAWKGIVIGFRAAHAAHEARAA
jgi:hypothetical protein